MATTGTTVPGSSNYAGAMEGITLVYIEDIRAPADLGAVINLGNWKFAGDEKGGVDTRASSKLVNESFWSYWPNPAAIYIAKDAISKFVPNPSLGFASIHCWQIVGVVLYFAKRSYVDSQGLIGFRNPGAKCPDGRLFGVAMPFISCLRSPEGLRRLKR